MRLLTPQFHYRLDTIVRFLYPLRFMSKLTQREDALPKETINQVRMLRARLKSSLKNKEGEVAKMIKEESFVYLREFKTSTRNQLYRIWI